MNQKAFVTKSGSATFLCPECGKAKHMDVSKFSNITKEVKLKCTCSCKHVFSVILERRQHVRKNVNLKGQLTFGKKCEPVDVIDISRLGLKIRAAKPLDLNIQDKVVLAFVLDDINQSRVSKSLIVKTIHKNEVGLKFVSDEHYDKFGNYILYQLN
jgi:hypothetical protein